jgi:hypothetical protein
VGGSTLRHARRGAWCSSSQKFPAATANMSAHRDGKAERTVLLAARTITLCLPDGALADATVRRWIVGGHDAPTSAKHAQPTSMRPCCGLTMAVKRLRQGVVWKHMSERSWQIRHHVEFRQLTDSCIEESACSRTLERGNNSASHTA